VRDSDVFMIIKTYLSMRCRHGCDPLNLVMKHRVWFKLLFCATFIAGQGNEAAVDDVDIERPLS
jgi:hypothetical protein